MNVVVERLAEVVHSSEQLIRQVAGRSPVVRDCIVVYVVRRDLVVLPDVGACIAKLTSGADEGANRKRLARGQIPVHLTNSIVAVPALGTSVGVVIDRRTTRVLV